MPTIFLYQQVAKGITVDDRYLSLTATYIFDFGKKINHGDNMGFDGTRKSSAL